MISAKVLRLRLFTTLAGLGLLASTSVAIALPVISAPGSVHFPYGVVQAGVTLANVGSTTITISGLNFTGDPPVSPALGYFILVPPNTTCNIGFIMPPGSACVVNYGYVQIAPGANSELVSLTLGFNGGASFETMLVNLVAEPLPANVPALSGQMLMLLVGVMSVAAAAALLRRRDA
jgi:hypothetical protein